MSTLQGKYLRDTYKDLLQISNSNIGIDETSRYIEDGEGTPSILAISTTRVGVGTDTPAYTLDVAGDINLTGSLKVNGADAVFSNWTVNGSDVYRSAGNVGIGTTNPQKTLHLKAPAHHFVLEDSDAAAGEKMCGIFNSNNNLNLGRYTDDFNSFTTDLIINNQGNVGIGTTDPVSILHIHGDSSDENGDVALRIQNPNSGTSTTSSIRFTNTTSTFDHAAIVATREGSGSNLGSLQFYTNQNLNSGTPAMTIDSLGNVGVGTTSPDAQLHVNTTRTSSTNATSFILSDNVTGTQTDGVYKSIRSTSNNGVSISEIRFIETDGTNNNTAIAFATQSIAGGLTERLRVHRDGNVGVGTTNPRAKFEVANAASNSALLFNVDTGENSKASIQSVDEDQILNTRPLLLNPTGGNVGIGTTDPEYRFHVQSGSAFLGLNYSSNLFGDTAANEMGMAYSNKLHIGSVNSSGNPRIGMTLEKDGNVGIGTETPDTKLHINRYDVIDTNVASERTQLRPVLTLTTSNNTTTGGSSVVYRGHGGSIDFYTPTYQNNIPSPTARIAAQIDSDSLSTWGGRLSFWCTMNQDSDYEERARLDHAGRWNIWSSSNVAQIIHTDQPNSGNNWFLRGYANAALHDNSNAITGFDIYTNGDMRNANGVYGTLTSDARLKENVVDASGKLQDLLSLKVKNFNRIGHDKKQIGFIAQEFEQVFPSLVSSEDTREYDDDGNVVSGIEDSKSLKVGMEFAILTKAIQEQQAIIESQQSTISDLVSRIETLENE
jgi:hypothetical protein